MPISFRYGVTGAANLLLTGSLFFCFFHFVLRRNAAFRFCNLSSILRLWPYFPISFIRFFTTEICHFHYFPLSREKTNCTVCPGSRAESTDQLLRVEVVCRWFRMVSDTLQNADHHRCCMCKLRITKEIHFQITKAAGNIQQPSAS